MTFILATIPPAAPGAGLALTLLFVYTGSALVVSFLCSILEAALLSVREAELEQRSADGESGAKTLLRLKNERLDDAISAILILNTIAHTLGVAGAGMQASKVWPDQPLLLNVIFPAVLTLLILVGTEIIPKTLGAVYASSMVGPVARLLSILVWLLRPLLMVTRLITGALTSHDKAPISRGELAAMVAVAERQGTLADRDSRLVSNALKYHAIQVRDVMTPRTVISMLDQNTSVSEFLDVEAKSPHSRIPIYRNNDRDNVVGLILQREVLSAAARGLDLNTPLSEFRRDVIYVTPDLSLDEALHTLTEAHEHLAMVRDGFGGVSGLVTLEDLLETLLGIEIVDESDRVVDLRAEAATLRDRRLTQREARRTAGTARTDARESTEPLASDAPAVQE